MSQVQFPFLNRFLEIIVGASGFQVCPPRTQRDVVVLALNVCAGGACARKGNTFLKNVKRRFPRCCTIQYYQKHTRLEPYAKGSRRKVLMDDWCVVNTHGLVSF